MRMRPLSISVGAIACLLCAVGTVATAAPSSCLSDAEISQQIQVVLTGCQNVLPSGGATNEILNCFLNVANNVAASKPCTKATLMSDLALELGKCGNPGGQTPASARQALGQDAAFVPTVRHPVPDSKQRNVVRQALALSPVVRQSCCSYCCPSVFGSSCINCNIGCGCDQYCSSC